MTNIRYEDVPIRENHDPMVNLSDYPFVIEPMYHAWNLSDDPTLWARKSIADKLLHIQQTQLGGKRFKIWDPWRSRVVQTNIYNKYWRELEAEYPEWDRETLEREVGVFVTKPDNPHRVPPHATGGSIDLTLVDEGGEELDLGTVFDHFGPEAAPDYFEENPGNDTARDNRRFLRTVMMDAGFGDDPDEWWHFDFGNQKWALFKDAPFAVYGEVTNPLEFNARIT